MNKTILQKCIFELSQSSPRLDYIQGMLETLLEMTPDTTEPIKTYTFASATPTPAIGVMTDKSEQEMLDAKARAAIEVVKAMSKE